jgi:hypothetical protein
MPSLAPGDSVVCRVKLGVVVNLFEEWDEEVIFDIVSVHSEGYMINVPENVYLKDTIYLTKENYSKFSVDKKFVGATVYYTTDMRIVRVYKKIDGMCCGVCKTFNSMAEPNQPDKKSFICWSCRNYKTYL